VHSDNNMQSNLTGRIGSEHLIISLSKKFKTRIHISKDSHRIYQGIYEVEEAVTLECNSSTKIHMCENFVSIHFSNNSLFYSVSTNNDMLHFIVIYFVCYFKATRCW
jgi:hypothetical protein